MNFTAIAQDAPAVFAHVTAIEYRTPATTASLIVRQNASHVWVACEGGCGRAITVCKASAQPLNFTDPHGPRKEIRLTAAPRRVCVVCH